MENNNRYRIIDIEKYYRKTQYLRFKDGPKCSITMTYSLDITKAYNFAKNRNEKINIVLLYLVSQAINSRDDYKLFYDYKKDELRCYEVSNPIHYIFNKETETCKPVYSYYNPDYEIFYKTIIEDTKKAEKDDYVGKENEPNFFNTSAMPWISYDSFSLELPDGYLYLNPNINWGKFHKEGDRILLPITIRMNHAGADGYLLSKFFLILEELIEKLK
ncbi:MAG: CatA-like O-acetyltransferase [Bacilli bacterium]